MLDRSSKIGLGLEADLLKRGYQKIKLRRTVVVAKSMKGITVGEPARAQDDATVHSMAAFLEETLTRVELLDEVIHATRDQIRARLRIYQLTNDKDFQRTLAEGEALLASGDFGPPDAPDLLDKRLQELLTQ